LPAIEGAMDPNDAPPEDPEEILADATDPRVKSLVRANQKTALAADALQAEMVRLGKALSNMNELSGGALAAPAGQGDDHDHGGGCPCGGSCIECSAKAVDPAVVGPAVAPDDVFPPDATDDDQAGATCDSGRCDAMSARLQDLDAEQMKLLKQRDQ